MSLIGWLTASVTDTTMALVEDGALLGPRQLDMGNSGLTEEENLDGLARLNVEWVDRGMAQTSHQRVILAHISQISRVGAS